MSTLLVLGPIVAMMDDCMAGQYACLVIAMPRHSRMMHRELNLDVPS